MLTKSNVLDLSLGWAGESCQIVHDTYVPRTPYRCCMLLQWLDPVCVHAGFVAEMPQCPCTAEA